MATSNSTSSIPPAPLLPKLAFSTSSFDLSAETDSTPNSETTTLTDRHDSLKESPRSSICSSRSTESSNPTTSKPPSTHKRVRFQESVCWSYFDVEQHIPTRPELEHKPSFLGRSWARFKSRNSSGDLDISSTTPAGLRHMQGKNGSVDMLTKVTTSPSGRPVLTRRTSSSSSSAAYSIQQPLRQSAGRRYDSADTHAVWRASAAKAKGDWDDLLSNPRQSRLYA
ncbi:hypothetical protein PRZ48_006825 [Zasmidium cellare]|uniref:Uncharacterized protein n=1 Tax=Zasmidium cellare TaxID=395010 RepID=A0ABR0EHM8_ZASCE|nr:hypothetical protein PRZ48_006825 [Zasmidium cellare]